MMTSAITARAILVAGWCGTLSLAMWWMHSYSIRPGELQGAPTNFKLAKAPKGKCFLFVHPKCPCSVATLENWTAIHRAAPDVMYQLVIVLPTGTQPDFSNGAALEWSKQNRWAQLRLDRNGVFAHQMHAKTSGEVLYYDSQGDLEFMGGITRARSSPGDSTAARTLVDCIAHSAEKSIGINPVYGCSLLGEQA